MNQMSIKLAASCLTMTLGSQAMAYGQEPGPDLPMDQVELVQAFYAGAETEGLCTPPMTETLLTLLGLSEEERAKATITVACAIQ